MTLSAQIDTESVRTRANFVLERLTDGMKRVTRREFAGPCPFCGGEDRFRVQPDAKRWLCRTCTDGKWSDVIDYVQQRDRVPFLDAVRTLAGDEVKTEPAPIARPAAPLASAPGEDWQAAALQAVHDTATLLFSYSDETLPVWKYLKKNRGILEDAAFQATLGFNPDWRQYGEYWLPPGLVIPSLIGGDFWALNVRTTKAARAATARKGKQLGKYTALSGSVKQGLYNVNALDEATGAVICEGELDAILLGQYLPAGFAAVATGGATMPARRWLLHMAHVDRVLLAFDRDEAGQQATARWGEALPRAVALQIPEGNDVTDYWAAGGDLAAWIREAVGV